jgi:hypothetical protein
VPEDDVPEVAPVVPEDVAPVEDEVPEDVAPVDEEVPDDVAPVAPVEPVVPLVSSVVDVVDVVDVFEVLAEADASSPPRPVASASLTVISGSAVGTSSETFVPPQAATPAPRLSAARVTAR